MSDLGPAEPYAEITRLTALVAEQQRQIEEGERVKQTYAKRLCEQNDILNELRPVREYLADAKKRIAGLENHIRDITHEYNAETLRVLDLQSSARKMKEALVAIEREASPSFIDTYNADALHKILVDIRGKTNAALQSAASLDLSTDIPANAGGELPFSRDDLGRMVRDAWIDWAKQQDAPKASWLVPYDDLSEPDKEADRQIGERVARFTWIGLSARKSLSPDWRKEAEKLAEALEEATDSYEEHVQYKSSYLVEKHGDKDSTASLRSVIADYHAKGGGDENA